MIQQSDSAEAPASAKAEADVRLAARLRHWVRYARASELQRILRQAADRLDEIATHE
jgi:hypothetical protein